ncbi:MAG: hypothetical protein ACK5VI_10700 [Opitutia bacterium]|jgi:hypothetical protein
MSQSSEAAGQDQFQQVANRRAGYSDQTEWALRIARKGGTLAAGEGLLIVDYYEARIKELEESIFGLEANAQDLQQQIAWWQKYGAT